MILRTLSSAYGAAAAWRRRWYARDASRRRRLARPVISIGNLGVGGSGKTPVVEFVARLLVDAGERPAVLTRGYARRVAPDGVTVVADGKELRAGLDTAGDEPLMLARALPGVAVLVGGNRYLSGRLAEQRFGATVHILDDGFQHLELARDVDLLLADEEDLADRPLPAGRLREPLAGASAADALLVTAPDGPAADRIARALHVPFVFLVTRTLGTPHAGPGAAPLALRADARVFAVAAIARPERFFRDVATRGWQLAGTIAFPDHHRFSRADVERVVTAARAAGAEIVLTTEKDAVRLDVHDLPGGPAIAAVPLTATVGPAPAFERWLLGRIVLSRESAEHGGAVTGTRAQHVEFAP